MARISLLRFSVLLVAFVFTACVSDSDSFDPELEGIDLPLIDPGTPEAAGVIAFLNDASTTFELLDIDVGLDRRAARNLIDERPFSTIEEVDAVAYVGRTALAKLLAWAEDGGWIPMESDRDTAMLALVNDVATTFELLDDTVGLDRRAAENIIAARPFATIAQLDAVAYVGPSALDKLAEYALANGYGEGPPPPPTEAPCAIISEYIEGQGNNNKAVEIYNCGGGAIALDAIGLCLVRNGDTTCSSTGAVGSGSLAVGAVWTVCRTLDGTFNDPYQPILDACDHAIGGPAIFNGDDRLILFHDVDGSGAFDAADTVLDRFGDPNVTPSSTIWAETNLRRCDLSPDASDVAAKFTTHPRNAWEHLGVPPSASCGVAMGGGEGDDCTSNESCGDGLRCQGRPNDESSPYGKCVDPIGGSGNDCDRWSPCPEDEICAGWTLWGEGTCVPQWMAGRYGGAVSSPIGDALDESLVVYGLASVPVDIEVQVRIDHPRRTDLRVTLIDPNGDSAVLWDRTSELEEWSRSFVTNGISRDDAVNGRWTLRVEDLVSGETGTLRHFQLFIVSRWD